MLLYYVHTTTYIQINFRYQRFIIVHFYRLILFHTQRCFLASLSVRVYNLGHPVMYARNFCTNKPSHKIYLYMSACSTQHHTLVNDVIADKNVVTKIMSKFTGLQHIGFNGFAKRHLTN